MPQKLQAWLNNYFGVQSIIIGAENDFSSLAEAFMFNGDTNKQETDSMEKLKTDKKLASLDEVTVYVSRLADKDDVLKYITENTKFKNYELIQADYSFEDFYNWYDYFVETESYCNVYRFY